MEYVLSIITINYNNNAGLIKTMQSVIGQTWKQFEYVIIDGGSNDGSKETILQHADHVSYWISEKDKGIYNAMNKGILAAKGEYVLFINSGDILQDKDILQNCQHSLLQQIDFVYGNTIFEKNGKQAFVNYPDKLSFSFFLTDSLCHQSTFIKRSLFENSPYNEDFKIISDWEFFVLKICRENKTYKHIPVTVSVFDVTGASAQQLAFNETERDIVIERYFPAFAADYDYIKALKLRRVKQLVYISQRPMAWKFLKAVINFIVFLIPSAKEKMWRS